MGYFKRKIKTGIRRKLVFLICLSVFFVVSVGIGLGYYGSINLLRGRTVESQSDTATLVAQFLNHLIAEEVGLLKAYAITDVIKQSIMDSNARFDAYDARELERYASQMDADWFMSPLESRFVSFYTQNTAALRLRELMAADTGVEELFITDKRGYLVVASHKTTDFYQADELWWQMAFAGKPGEVFIGDYSYDESAQLWGIAFTAAIRDKCGEVIGVAKAVMNASILFSPLKDFKIGRTGHVFLVDEHGNMLFHEGVHNGHAGIMAPRQLNSLLSAKGRSGYFYSPVEKERFFASAALVTVPSFIRQSGRWIVVMSQEEGDVFSALHLLVYQGIFLFIFLTLLLIPVAVIFGRHFVRPLEELARASGQVAAGRLDYELDIRTGDEIEGLAEAFKAMIVKIKQNQAAILSEKAYLDNIITSMNDALFIFDLKGNIMDVNKAALELLGYERSELISAPADAFFETTGLFLENLQYERLRRHGLIKDIDMTWKTKQGERIPVYFSMSFLYEDENLKAVIGVARDMRDIKKLIQDLEHSKGELQTFSSGLEKMVQERTEKLERTQKATINILADMNAAQEELKNANAELKKLDELKSDFVSHVSHELRTPLSVIKESVDIVRDGTVGSINDEQVDFLDTAKRNVDRLVHLINAILDLQKLEAGRVEFNFGYYDIAEFIRDVHKSYSLLAEEKGLAFDLRIRDNLPLVKFDKDKIVQVLSNLLSNSLKFTQKGGIEISVEKSGNVVKVAVKDTGDGVKKENIPKLFGKFVQLANKIGGSGLGLALCKEIIEAHQGRIWMESELGQGTTVFFILPLEERRQ